MQRKLLILLVIVAALSLGMVGMAQATATWQFAPTVPSNITGDIGSNSFVFTDTTSGYNVPLPAYAFTAANVPPNPIAIGGTWDPTPLTDINLYAKVTAGDPGETGLGLTPTTAHEIQVNTFIALDSLPMKNLGYNGLSLGIGSMQAGEGFYLWGYNPVADPLSLTLLATATGLPDVQSINVPDFASYQFFAISATPPGTTNTSDVLILNGAQAVPVPPAVLLFGSGLVGLATFGRSRKYLKS